MSMDLRHFAAFVAVAEALHFRRAAERLHLAQPALSRTIRQLEDHVGAPLLERSTRSVALTRAGAALLPEARAALASAERALASARAAATGTSEPLHITYMDFAINGALPGLLAQLRQAHPALQVTLRHLWTEAQRQALRQREVDLGFLVGPFEAQDISTLVVQRERLCVVLPEGHRLARRRRIAIADLRDEPLVLGNREAWAPFRQVLDHLCQQAGFAPLVVQEAFNSDGIFGLVAAGLGLTVYVDGGIGHRREGTIARPLWPRSASVETVAAWHEHNRSPALAHFLDILRSHASTAAR